MYCAFYIRCTTAVIRCHWLPFVGTRCHSLSLVVPFVVTCYHSLSFVVTRYHSLSFVVTRCTTRCHSLSFVVTSCTTLCHSLSLVVTRCTTCLSFYKRSTLLCCFLCYYFPILYSMSDKKLFLKEIKKRNSHKTQSKWSIASFGEERLKFFQKQGDYSHSRGEGENWTKIGRSPRRMERDNRSVK